MVRKMYLKREGEKKKNFQYQVEENFESKDRDKNEKPNKKTKVCKRNG